MSTPPESPTQPSPAPSEYELDTVSPDSTPLCLSPSLYSWDTSIRVCFDQSKSQLLHIVNDGIYAIGTENAERGEDCSAMFINLTNYTRNDDGKPESPDGGLKIASSWVKDVRIAPNDNYLCIHGTPVQSSVTLWLNTVKNPTARTAEPVMFKKGGALVDLLDFQWIPPSLNQIGAVAENGAGRSFDDLVVVTTAGVEVFRVVYQPTLSVSSTRWVGMQIRMCWCVPSIVLVCMGSKTLQPIDTRLSRQSMPKFDLYVQKPITRDDVDLCVISGMVYCIHLDQERHRLSLRNITEPGHSAPEHDVVIDLNGASRLDISAVGSLKLAVCDDLLIVHKQFQGLPPPLPIGDESPQSINENASLPAQYWVFDIRIPQTPLWETDEKLTIIGTTSEVEEEFVGFYGPHVIDEKKQLRLMHVDLRTLHYHLQKHWPLAAVVPVLLRRSDCRNAIICTVRQALEREDSEEWARCCTALNSAYRIAIEESFRGNMSGANSTRTSQASSQPQSAIINLHTLIASQSSIVSEKEMVQHVFLPYLQQRYPSVRMTRLDEGERLQYAPSEIHSTLKGDGTKPYRPPYFVSAVLSYTRSILNKNIYPHKILQGFLFDILLLFDQDHLLQQMLHYHVLIDNDAILFRLRDRALITQERWIIQACTDMGLRLSRLHLIVDVLVGTGRVFQALAFILARRITNYPLKYILAELKKEDDLDIAIDQIRAWMNDKSTPSPNVEDCDEWGLMTSSIDSP